MRIENRNPEEEETETTYLMTVSDEKQHERLCRGNWQEQPFFSESVCWTEIPSKILWRTIFESKAEELGDPTDEQYMVQNSLVAAVLQEFTLRHSSDNRMTLLAIPSAHQAKLFCEIMVQYDFTKHCQSDQQLNFSKTFLKKVSVSDKHLLARVKIDFLTRMNMWKKQMKKKHYKT